MMPNLEHEFKSLDLHGKKSNHLTHTQMRKLKDIEGLVDQKTQVWCFKMSIFWRPNIWCDGNNYLNVYLKFSKTMTTKNCYQKKTATMWVDWYIDHFPYSNNLTICLFIRRACTINIYNFNLPIIPQQC